MGEKGTLSRLTMSNAVTVPGTAFGQAGKRAGRVHFFLACGGSRI
jgi:hypothetical protein